MTDVERMQVFEQKKQETIDRLLGKSSTDVDDKSDNEMNVDVNWNRGKPWYDEIRMHSNMNCRNKLDTLMFDMKMRNNGGYLVSVMEKPLGEEAPVIK